MRDIPFIFDLKAVDGAAPMETPVELEDGDLLIEGWGVNYDVIDREDEFFADGSFTKGLKKFLAGNAPLVYHHHYDQVLGKVIDADHVPGKGVKVRAIVDKQGPESPLHHVYEGIRKGRINGLSAGGRFVREMTPTGMPKIVDVDLLEWSATATPVGPTALFSVIAGKALSAPETPDLSPEPELELAPARPGTPTFTEEEIEEAKRILTASEEAQEAARPETDEEKAEREAAEQEEADRIAAEEAAAREAAAQQDAAEMQALVTALDDFGSRLEAIASRWAAKPDVEETPEVDNEISPNEEDETKIDED